MNREALKAVILKHTTREPADENDLDVAFVDVFHPATIDPSARLYDLALVHGGFTVTMEKAPIDDGSYLDRLIDTLLAIYSAALAVPAPPSSGVISATISSCQTNSAPPSPTTTKTSPSPESPSSSLTQ